MQAVNRNKTGITLVEACIAGLLLSVVMAVVMSMFAGGLKGSNKGMAHLTNMQTAAIIMSQIEYDLMRAVEINDPAAETNDSAARWRMANQDGSTSTVIYSLLTNGLERQEESGSGDKFKHIFGRGLNLSVNFRHLKFDLPDSHTSRKGMWVELKVSSDKDHNEEFMIKRMVVCRSLDKDI